MRKLFFKRYLMIFQQSSVQKDKVKLCKLFFKRYLTCNHNFKLRYRLTII